MPRKRSGGVSHGAQSSLVSLAPPVLSWDGPNGWFVIDYPPAVTPSMFAIYTSPTEFGDFELEEYRSEATGFAGAFPNWYRATYTAGIESPPSNAVRSEAI